MSRWTVLLVAFAFGAVGLATGALADAGHDGTDGAPRIVAQAPNARAAALVGPGGDIIRGHGFVAVKKIASGQYCLKVPISINARRAIASVTPEWEYTAHDRVGVFWMSNSADCGRPARWIQVYTYNDLAGGLSDEPFSVVVP